MPPANAPDSLPASGSPLPYVTGIHHLPRIQAESAIGIGGVGSRVAVGQGGVCPNKGTFVAQLTVTGQPVVAHSAAVVHGYLEPHIGNGDARHLQGNGESDGPGRLLAGGAEGQQQGGSQHRGLRCNTHAYKVSSYKVVCLVPVLQVLGGQENLAGVTSA